MPSASVSTPSAPSRIGSRLPGSQIQMVSPIAVSSATAVRTGTITARTKREPSSPTISTITEPPTNANSGDSSL